MSVAVSTSGRNGDVFYDLRVRLFKPARGQRLGRYYFSVARAPPPKEENRQNVQARFDKIFPARE
ncbi:hypothetical protein [uncultured Rikenella sp.]|uniref:hypothetical protein n=1 Tax=uncultured Rikenella sp. TaxID=368003 RepID=UPI0025E9494F|nr:hypothetical protein [uncultured Rikenella sp.]